MLSREDNELLARVGPGSPMGALIRSYWLPLVYSQELASDGPPLRVRLLGEDLIAFRDSNGQAGLIAQACPHRGASLFFGRNEEAGLRCVYHGWKFDTAGTCVDMPNEPAESNFRHKIRATAYPCLDRGGAVWAYLGTRLTPPPFPELELTLVPENQRAHSWREIRHCNWMQALEGDLDSSHASYLHSRLQSRDTLHRDGAPVLEVVETDYGAMYGARRTDQPGRHYWRTSHFMFPCFTLFPASEEGSVPGNFWLPVDDEHTLVWQFRWHPFRPLTQAESPVPGITGEPRPVAGQAWGWLMTNGNAETDYLLDRKVQRDQTFSGIPSVPLQDHAVTESMGVVNSRTAEHLGTTDAMIIQVRRRIIKAAHALQDNGTTPPAVDNPAAYRLRSASVYLPSGADWFQTLLEWHNGRAGLPVGP